MKLIQRLCCAVRIIRTDCEANVALIHHPTNPSANKDDDVVSLLECATAWRYCRADRTRGVAWCEVQLYGQFQRA